MNKDRILQEWELVSICNYKCNYCLLPELKYELNTNTLKNFMDNLDKNIELFCFGGEPFLHKKIKFIIDYLNEIKQPFVIQSNGSSKSIEVIKKENITNFRLQISIHPSQLSLDELKENIIKLKSLKDVHISRIDVMYIGLQSIKYYIEVNKNFENVYLLPISGFYEDASCDYTKEYNELRKLKKYSFIKFEENYIDEYNMFRSEVWQNQCENKISTLNRPCPYDYKLYDSKLKLHNCCYRDTNNGICKHQKCFWM